MSFKKIISLTFLGLISVGVFMVGFVPRQHHTPQEAYQVYLDGDVIGLIKSKSALEEYINKEQSDIKKKYNVDKVYVPNGLEIKKVITYSTNISSAKSIYKKIKNLDSFTIEGYSITIKSSTNKQKVYVLDKTIFEEAVDTTVKAFVDEDTYQAYLDAEQSKITTTGKIIEDVSIDEKISIDKTYISANEKIYTNVETLTKYLLYGTTKSQTKYTVQDGDTIDQIAYSNKLSTAEFLVANPDFNSSEVLLLAGQAVNVGLISPKITVSETEYVVADETKKYSTEIVYDETLAAGTSYVRQEGSNGLNRVTQRVTKVNGETETVEILGTQELTPTVNEIIVKGDKYVSNVGVSGYWYWPTISPYVITTYYGYRWGSMHPAIDVAGCGYNSPIYAANNGTVVTAGYRNSYGNYVLINHNNGYYTQYAHLSKIYVKVGETVTRGQVIGGMGNTGYVVGRTGIHLHYGMWYGGEPDKGGTSLNPLKYY